MKKIFLLAMGIMLVALTAGFAVAYEGDIAVDVRNSNDNSNTITVDTNASSNQDQQQQQQQQQKQNQVTITRGNLLTVSFNGLPVPGKADKGEWKVLCTEMYMDWAPEDIERATYKKGFWDILTFDWGTNYEFYPMRKALASNSSSMSCLDYWPEWESRNGDRALGSVMIEGKVKTPNAAFVAQAYDVCKKETGASWVAIIKQDLDEDVTTGLSLNISGALSKITGDGNSGNAVASGIGGGKARVRKEGLVMVQAVCMDHTPTPPKDDPPVALPVVQTPAPQPAKVCDQSIYLVAIAKADAEIFKCKPYSHNNLFWQLEALKKNISEYLCGGKKEMKYIEDAIQHAYMAELNYINGRDISKFSDSEKLIAEVDYYLGSAFYLRDGNTKGYWKMPDEVRHINKKTGKYEWITTTSHEKKEILKLRRNMENYSTDLTLN